MARITVEKDGRVALPENYRQRHGLEGGTELVFEPIEDGLMLRFARPDARRAYIEVTAKEMNMPTEQEIREALRPVMDPEIGMSVVDLGMIQEVAIEGDAVEVKMVLTAPFCPLADFIVDRVRQAAATVPGVREARVTLLDEPWDPSWMKR